MAPDACAGWVVELDRRKQAQPGNGILVKDKRGNLYFRKLRQGRGAWEAHALNDAYLSLMSDVDGLEIVAVMVGLTMPGWNM